MAQQSPSRSRGRGVRTRRASRSSSGELWASAGTGRRCHEAESKEGKMTASGEPEVTRTFTCAWTSLALRKRPDWAFAASQQIRTKWASLSLANTPHREPWGRRCATCVWAGVGAHGPWGRGLGCWATSEWSLPMGCRRAWKRYPQGRRSPMSRPWLCTMSRRTVCCCPGHSDYRVVSAGPISNWALAACRWCTPPEGEAPLGWVLVAPQVDCQQGSCWQWW
jgi:hypothetical protein